MTGYYVLNEKHSLPRFVVIAVASWVVALGMVTVVGLAVTVLSSIRDFDALAALPRSVAILLGVCGAYAALGGICLWVTMWFSVQREPLVARIGWFFALLLGLHYGAMFYAWYVLASKLRRVDGRQLIATV